MHSKSLEELLKQEESIRKKIKRHEYAETQKYKQNQKKEFKEALPNLVGKCFMMEKRHVMYRVIYHDLQKEDFIHFKILKQTDETKADLMGVTRGNSGGVEISSFKNVEMDRKWITRQCPKEQFNALLREAKRIMETVHDA